MEPIVLLGWFIATLVVFRIAWRVTRSFNVGDRRKPCLVCGNTGTLVIDSMGKKVTRPCPQCSRETTGKP